MLGLTDYLDRQPRQLSGGQRQRVAMGRAIVRKPAVFLFDEPLSNLDAKLRVQMRSEIKQNHQRLKTTTVYVTHDQIEAMTMADRIVVMNDGRIEQIGSPLELYDRPANRFVGGFIGSPAMNMFEGRIEGGAFLAADGTRIAARRPRRRPAPRAARSSSASAPSISTLDPAGLAAEGPDRRADRLGNPGGHAPRRPRGRRRLPRAHRRQARRHAPRPAAAGAVCTCSTVKRGCVSRSFHCFAEQ